MASLSLPDIPTIRRYLLGDLPEAETVALEERYFADPEAFEQVWAVENDLVDDYVAGRLDSAEQERFESHYLSSPPHRERVAAARALRGRSSDSLTASRAKPGSFTWWLVAAVLPLLLGAMWLLTRRTAERPIVVEAPQTPTPGPSEIRTPPSPSPALRPPVVVAFALSPILVRGGKEQPKVDIPPGTDEVVLNLGGEQVAANRLTFVLRAVDGAAIVSGRAEPAPRSLPWLVASVRVPAARLPSGDYILVLSAAGDDEPLNQYYFRVPPR